MSSLNRACILGNVGRDPEIRHTQSGAKVASFSIATSERWKDRTTGEEKEQTEWHRIVVWSEGLIGVIEKYIKKGAKVYVEGQLRTRKWQDQAGADHYSTEIVISGFNGKLVMTGGGGNRPPNHSDADAPLNAGPGGDASSAPRPRRGELDDDIPF